MNETAMPTPFAFPDHFSSLAAQYADARPEYPPELFAWIADIAPARDRVWEAGCGSGQATRGLAPLFAEVFATDASAQQIAHAPTLANARFAVAPAERCELADASVDAVCVAQAMHWFDRPRFFAEAARVLKSGGVLVVWGYRDIEVPESLRQAVDALDERIRDDWPAERAYIDREYADFMPLLNAPPFATATANPPPNALVVDWPLSRMLGYFSSYSATKHHIEATGIDPVALHADAIAAAWGDPQAMRRLRWPLFVHARRKI